MSHAIPTTPQDDPSHTIMAALAHGMTGHPEKAVALFHPFIHGGPATTLGLCAALAEMSAMKPRQQLPKGAAFGLLVLDAETAQPRNINALPTGLRFAAQFSTAWANNDRDTARALFAALITPDTDEAASALADGIRALFDMAVASLNEMTGRTNGTR